MSQDPHRPEVVELANRLIALDENDLLGTLLAVSFARGGLPLLIGQGGSGGDAGPGGAAGGGGGGGLAGSGGAGGQVVNVSGRRQGLLIGLAVGVLASLIAWALTTYL